MVGSGILQAYAERIVGFAVNLQRGQELVVAAPAEATPLVDYVAQAALRRGAAGVTVAWEKPDELQARLRDAGWADWVAEVRSASQDVAARLRRGAAHLTVHAPRPDLLAGFPTPRIAAMHAALATARAEEARILAAGLTNASAAVFVTAAWASCVFPDLGVEDATTATWTVVAEGLRLEADEGDLRERSTRLSLRRERLQALNLRVLAFTGRDVALRMGLVEGHVWRGGPARSAAGIDYLPSLPSEALFTAPAAGGTQGTITFGRPIAIVGDRVERLAACFIDGEACELTAQRGRDAFECLLNGDGGRRLGKVALVERGAPFAQRGLHYVNPLLDSAASPHVSFGRSAPGTAPPNADVNRSALHIDAYFGDSDLAVDGLGAAGSAVEIMREGVFLI